MTAAPTLIALCSPAMGSGKSTLAEHLASRHNFVRIAFATPLKMMTRAFLQHGLGLPGDTINDMVNGHLKEQPIDGLDVTPRHLMQTLGTEWGRDNVDPNLWVRLAMIRTAAYHSMGRSVVIDDMRFPNEYDAVQAAGGQCYRIVRPDAVVTAAHVSEGQLDGIAMPEIWNNGSRDDLFAAADRLVVS